MDPVLALRGHLVDADDRMVRDVGMLDPAELGLELFLGRVDQQFGALAENDLADLDEAHHRSLAHLVRVQLVDFALVVENHAENALVVVACHGAV